MDLGMRGITQKEDKLVYSQEGVHDGVELGVVVPEVEIESRGFSFGGRASTREVECWPGRVVWC